MELSGIICQLQLSLSEIALEVCHECCEVILAGVGSTSAAFWCGDDGGKIADVEALVHATEGKYFTITQLYLDGVFLGGIHDDPVSLRDLGQGQDV